MTYILYVYIVMNGFSIDILANFDIHFWLFGPLSQMTAFTFNPSSNNLLIELKISQK